MIRVKFHSEISISNYLFFLYRTSDMISNLVSESETLSQEVECAHSLIR